MKQKDLRTYQRRGVTRNSGFHTCEETTGGECLVKKTQAFLMHESKKTFCFKRKKISLVELFDSGNGIIAFGGYIFTNKLIKISFHLEYEVDGHTFDFSTSFQGQLKVDDWSNIGFHKEVSLDYGDVIESAMLLMTIDGEKDTALEFISFDFDAVSKTEYIGSNLAKSFLQKTMMHVPYLYYLETLNPFETYLAEVEEFSPGQIVVLKSCNRCGRYLPINIVNELNTLSFSLHCKKRAPCVHSTFKAYTIQNPEEIETESYEQLILQDNKVVSYYGHQLECKACKKFFVNAPLNPQRNPQQFKEDGLRRRAIEALVNRLLKKNLIHFEFEHRTKKEFSEYIWNKFNRRCFKCNKELPIDEMHLDHTMPLAYLYRLDETATCLCGSHNSQKGHSFPVDYYSQDELLRLSQITGLPMKTLTYRGINRDVLRLLVKNVVWFYDKFLNEPEFQKVRDGILTADKVNESLKRVINGEVDLAEEYRAKVGKYPNSITII